ncbi:amidohydrolase family protein [Lacrimispora sp.]|uniref:amidohydrolase family protein n=1 Tax=Lacrimispora sp. TaxID=2719234 RepID=UPI002859B651|nr:amidohydrolase family protein [Lacrimispora sp.]MDR7810659.1 amidohydrolase family protein [Lacrimispora sp.]
MTGGKNFVLKGNVCYSEDDRSLKTMEQGYLVCQDGKSAGVYKELPVQYADYPLQDWGDMLIVPGLVDLHIHAPQFSFRGLGMDLELLDWLNTNTFPEEAKYADLEYAKKAYGIFAEAMKKSATTRACIFGTIHRPATELLMDLMEETGLKTMIGKVNMDRNSPDYLREQGAEESEKETLCWLEETGSKYENVKPILTPRFIPSCTDDLMERLGRLQKENGLPVQSHLSENQGEVTWVKELCPASEFYGDAYDQFGLFGGNGKTVMAHCVSSSEEEIELIKERGVYIAHCPQSNTNLSSGIAPVRTYLDRELNVGLGTDVAGGSGESIFRAMADAIQVSKLRWRLKDERLKPLTVEEAFYLGTLGGGSFFGKVGSFLEGYEFDALILDDSGLPHPQALNLKERLERFIYLSDDRHLKGKYTGGNRIF